MKNKYFISYKDEYMKEGNFFIDAEDKEIAEEEGQDYINFELDTEGYIDGILEIDSDELLKELKEHKHQIRTVYQQEDGFYYIETSNCFVINKNNFAVAETREQLIELIKLIKLVKGGN